MALRLTKLADEAIQWLREKYETLRNQLTIGRSRMSKDPYRIISEGTRETATSNSLAEDSFLVC